MSIKTDIIGEQTVMGNLKDFLQTYNIYYYPPEQNFPTSKVWLYLHGKENGKPRMIRSLCFDNINIHRKFIFNNILYQIYWLEKKGIEFKPSQMDIFTYRKALLDSLMIDLRKKLLKKIEEMSRVQANEINLVRTPQ